MFEVSETSGLDFCSWCPLNQRPFTKRALPKASGSSGVASKLFIGRGPSILQALIAQPYLHAVKMACEKQMCSWHHKSSASLRHQTFGTWQTHHLCPSSSATGRCHAHQNPRQSHRRWNDATHASLQSFIAETILWHKESKESCTVREFFSKQTKWFGPWNTPNNSGCDNRGMGWWLSPPSVDRHQNSKALDPPMVCQLRNGKAPSQSRWKLVGTNRWRVNNKKLNWWSWKNWHVVNSQWQVANMETHFHMWEHLLV